MAKLTPNKKNNYRKKLKQDPNLCRVRENNTEFAAAAFAGSLIRNAFRAQTNVITIASRSSVGNLQKRLIEVMQSDPVSERGKRTIANGDFSLMKNFQFNNEALLHKIFYAHFKASTDRPAGKLSIHIPGFVPALSMTAPAATTHFQIVTAAAEFNFHKKEFHRSETRSDELPLNLMKTEPITLEISISKPSTLAFIHVLAIEFYQEVNGRMYILRENTKSAIGVIQAESALW